ncbi:hypothetical protein ACFFV7_07845 [Nonomuraea spiralis]|uniref:Uncharacterized protein n=1 Tax=Nonomuraea spiralis TaxID=46182 RepID=A0ABV5I985_9ACTN|nr:hypothetical protein [Nonomuraea spiralis]GGS76891.1 hypothetical protein GCM10010176_020050 [Nonomuraea spiralis]
MEPADGRVILFVLIGLALFALGRRFQNMIMLRQVWKQTQRQVTVRRETAHHAVKGLVGVTAVAAFVIWLAINLNRIMS